LNLSVLLAQCNNRATIIAEREAGLLQVEYAEISLIGSRSENQDRIAATVNTDAALVAAFDGMGGHADGAHAAELARRSVLARFATAPHPLVDPLAFLHLSLGAAHNEIVAYGLKMPMEQRPRATGAMCIVQDGMAWFAHVGDSRVYHLRAGHVISRTRDHSHVELLLQEGLINSTQAMNHPMRNYVETCLGGDPMLPEMLIGRGVKVMAGDTLLVCTDGFWSNLLDEDIAASLYSSIPLKTALTAITEFSVRRAGHGADNSSVAALRIL
jgi:PPM family protein phosphatase